MKKVIFLIVLLFGVYYLFNNNSSPTDVSQLSGLNKITTVRVTGIVMNNFKILDNGFYELKDRNTSESIYVISSKSIPKIGNEITKKLKKGDLMTFNDKTFSVYEEID